MLVGRRLVRIAGTDIPYANALLVYNGVVLLSSVGDF